MPAALLVQDWADRLAKVIESMTGHPYQLKVQSSGGDSPGLLWWEQSFSVGSKALLWVGAPPQTSDLIARNVLRAAGIEEPNSEDLEGAYQEVLSQSFASLANGFSSQLRREINCSGGRNAAPPSELQERFVVALEEPHQLFVVVSPGLTSALEEEEANQPPAKQLATASKAQAPGSPPSKTLDLLLDVELPVSVSFGRAQLPLKDVIKLTTGSIVELNRAVSEPVEIIVNNCVIARGQVVVVEGNFGVRIQQIISRQERLRTLK